MVGIENYTIALGGINNGMIGGAIRDPANMLGEGREETGGVDPSIGTSKAIFPRSIKGTNILEISSKSPNGSNRAGRSSGGKDNSDISNSPSIVKTMHGQEGASRSMVIYAIASTRRGTPGIMGLAILIFLD